MPKVSRNACLPSRRSGLFYLISSCVVFLAAQVAAEEIPAAAVEELAKPVHAAAALLKDVADAAGRPLEIEPVVVTARRGEQPYSTVTVPLSVVTEEDIQIRKNPEAVEYLRDLPGVWINQSGGRGRDTNILIRGANENHTLVMVDGVKVNSPTTGTFNFNSLSSNHVESIEVVRGPQAALYGSDSIGGVVNVITKRGEGPAEFTAQAEYGSNETFNESLMLQAGNEKAHLSASASRYDTEGRSEGDDYDSTNVSVRGGIAITDWLEWDTKFRYDKNMVEIDDGAFRVDINNYSRNKNNIFSTRLHGPLEFDGRILKAWDQSLEFRFYHQALLNVDPPDPDTAQTRSKFKLDANTYGLHYHTQVEILEFLNFIAGVEWEHTKVNNKGFKRNLRSTGYYAMNQFAFGDKLFFDAGLRLEDHSQFGRDLNPQFSAMYHFKKAGTRLRAAYGTGFRAPTFNQLFFPNFGNAELDPEESETYSAGFEQALGRKGTFSADVFHTSIDNLIGFRLVGANFQAINFGKAKTDGVELSARWQLSDAIRLSAFYNFLTTRDKDLNGKELIRRPKHAGGISAWIGWKDWELYSNLQLVGTRKDRAGFGFPFRQVNPAYEKWDATLTYHWKDSAQIFGRAENLTSRFYSEVIGFPSEGTQFFVGMRMRAMGKELGKAVEPVIAPAGRLFKRAKEYYLDT